MSDDPYKVLGVDRNASAEDIRKAYRRLAKTHHPDLNPGDRKAEEQFKRITTAYDILGDPDKRGRYDRGEIDASGAERPDRQFYRHYAEGPGGEGYQSTAGFADFADLGDVFSDLFGGARRPGRGGIRMAGGDLRYQVTVGFLDAVNGTRKRFTMPDGRNLEVRIPAGLTDGQILRLKGQGMPGLGGGPAGDALIEVHIEPHPVFERRGNDIHVDLPVTLAEAVLGGRVRVPTVSGAVTLTVPKRSSSGATLRLRGKGVPDQKTKRHGDQYVHLKIVLPDQPDEALEAFIRDWAPAHPYDPRSAMES